MPTGYTARLIESGQTFEQFLFGCARAFGALVTMRDDSLDAPIPEEFTPSTYYARAAEDAAKKLSRLRSLGLSGRAEEVQAFRKRKQDAAAQYIASARATNERLAGMERQVRAWTPPSPDHQELKTFMLQQLDISKDNTSYTEKELAEMNAKSDAEIWQTIIGEAEHSATYCANALVEENERVASRNLWLKQLRESVSEAVQA